MEKKKKEKKRGKNKWKKKEVPTIELANFGESDGFTPYATAA